MPSPSIISASLPIDDGQYTMLGNSTHNHAYLRIAMSGIATTAALTMNARPQ